MFHDHRALKRVSRKMRAPEPAIGTTPPPSLAELIARIEAALAARETPPR